MPLTGSRAPVRWLPVADLDNPADRLHSLIVDFRRNATSGRPSWHTWAATIGVPINDTAEVLRCLGLVLALPGEIEAELAKVDRANYKPDLARAWQKILPTLSSALFTPEQSNQVAAQFDELSLVSLEYCGWTLSTYRQQRPVADSDLKRIRELIGELESELRDSPNIDPELREFLQLRCDEMSRALRDLTIRGPAALADAWDKAVGATVRQSAVVIRRDTAPGAWEKFKEILNTTALVLGTMASAASLAVDAQQALEGPPPPAQVKVVVESPQPPAEPGSGPVEHPNGARRAPGKEPAAGN